MKKEAVLNTSMLPPTTVETTHTPAKARIGQDAFG